MSVQSELPENLKPGDVFAHRYKGEMELCEQRENGAFAINVFRSLLPGETVFRAVQKGDYWLPRDGYTLQDGDVASTKKIFTYNGEDRTYYVHVFTGNCPKWLRDASTPEHKRQSRR